MSLLRRKSQIAVEIEAVEGTKETLVDADVFLAFNPTFTPSIDMYERDLRHTYLSPYASLPGRKMATLSFDVELVGTAAGAGEAIQYTDALQACGVDETLVASTSATYTPLSSGVPSVTIGWYHDGKAYRMWGARGSAVLNMNAGEPGIITMTFQGADWEEVDTALLSPTYETAKPPVFLGATLTIDSYSAKVSRLGLDLGNALTLRSDVNQSSGYFSTIITGRRPIITFDPEDVLVATEDFLGNWESGAEMAFSTSIGSAAGNTIGITAPKVQYQAIGISDREEVLVKELTGLCCIDSGDDEWQIQIT